MSKTSKTIFRIQFHNHSRVYEIYANEVSQAHMAGFIEIGEIIFGEQSRLLIDPAEEKLKTEFAHVKHTFVPHHAIIRIDEVEQSGKNRILDSDGSTVTHFPGSTSTPNTN